MNKNVVKQSILEEDDAFLKVCYFVTMSIINSKNKMLGCIRTPVSPTHASPSPRTPPTSTGLSGIRFSMLPEWTQASLCLIRSH